jgi:hypothetical protein
MPEVALCAPNRRPSTIVSHSDSGNPGPIHPPVQHLAEWAAFDPKIILSRRCVRNLRFSSSCARSPHFISLGLVLESAAISGSLPNLAAERAVLGAAARSFVPSSLGPQPPTTRVGHVGCINKSLCRWARQCSRPMRRPQSANLLRTDTPKQESATRRQPSQERSSRPEPRQIAAYETNRCHRVHRLAGSSADAGYRAAPFGP